MKGKEKTETKPGLPPVTLDEIVKCYVVLCEHGSYDDHFEFIDCICAKKETADARAEEINNDAGNENLARVEEYDFCT